MERFLRVVLGGGIAMLAGLWLAIGSVPETAQWVGGWILALAGGLALLAGIRIAIAS